MKIPVFCVIKQGYLETYKKYLNVVVILVIMTIILIIKTVFNVVINAILAVIHNKIVNNVALIG